MPGFGQDTYSLLIVLYYLKLHIHGYNITVNVMCQVVGVQVEIFIHSQFLRYLRQ